ncbi:MAG: hypothetical protein H8E17_09005 [Deltaproteobacteria bacterium]|nr:hypothetical protein [Deltaproteobacteria bacterium]
MKGFTKWMGSEEGLQSMEALDYVFEALDGAEVDIAEKKIIWADGQILTIEQSAERIQKQAGLDMYAILSHIIGWLQMEYVPKELDDKQMEMFEYHIDVWVEEFENRLIKPYRF